SPAMIDSTQASADQTACGATPLACSAQLAPVSAQDARSRCIRIPRKAIRISARPAALSNTWRKAGVNICEQALMAASIMPQHVTLAAAASKSAHYATGESVLSRAGATGSAVAASAAGRSAHAIAL